RIYRFDNFQLDAANRELLRDGKPVQLPAKAFDLLLALLECNGRLVGKAKRKANPASSRLFPGMVIALRVRCAFQTVKTLWSRRIHSRERLSKARKKTTTPIRFCPGALHNDDKLSIAGAEEDHLVRSFVRSVDCCRRRHLALSITASKWTGAGPPPDRAAGA